MLCLLAACGPLLAQQAVQRLEDVRKIYIDSFGTGNGADLIRSKLISRLVKAGRFDVVQSAD